MSGWPCSGSVVTANPHFRGLKRVKWIAEKELEKVVTANPHFRGLKQS